VSGALVRVQGLEKRFGAVTAIDGIDLEIGAGSTLAIVGPNGAGKSTLLRILAGLAHPTAGRCVVDVPGDPKSAIGYLGHASLLYPDLTARENLVFAARLYRVADPGGRADALLDEEGLAAVSGRPTGSFSRGMAQRLSIARARVHDPALLLLDEPYTGLDRRSVDRLGARLKELERAGHTLVLVTHDVGHAAALADEVVVLVAGRVAARWRGEELTPGALEARYHDLIEEHAP